MADTDEGRSARIFSAEEVARRQAEKAAENLKLRATLKIRAENAIATLPRDAAGIPYVVIKATDPEAWKTLMFHSQRFRDRGDLKGRIFFAEVAHGFEMKFWEANP